MNKPCSLLHTAKFWQMRQSTLSYSCSLQAHTNPIHQNLWRLTQLHDLLRLQPCNKLMQSWVARAWLAYWCRVPCLSLISSKLWCRVYSLRLVGKFYVPASCLQRLQACVNVYCLQHLADVPFISSSQVPFWMNKMKGTSAWCCRHWLHGSGVFPHSRE